MVSGIMLLSLPTIAKYLKPTRYELECCPHSFEAYEKHGSRKARESGRHHAFADESFSIPHEHIHEYVNDLFKHYTIKKRLSYLDPISLKFCMPLSIVAQWTKHRVLTSSESGRYVKTSNDTYIPDFIRRSIKNIKQGSSKTEECDHASILKDMMKEHADRSNALYYNLISNNAAREISRFILPQSQYTNIVQCGTVGDCNRIIGLRSAHDAQWEIQQYSDVLKNFITNV
jgi:flavin-dependent thymidylate synthase